MTRKDYILLADALNRAVSWCVQHGHNTTPARAAAEHIAAALADDNPRFERERFLKACGVAS